MPRYFLNSGFPWDHCKCVVRTDDGGWYLLRHDDTLAPVALASRYEEYIDKWLQEGHWIELTEPPA